MYDRKKIRSAQNVTDVSFFVVNVDPSDMTSPTKPTTESNPLLKFKSARDTKQVDFTPGDSSQQFTIGADMDPK